MKNFLIAMCLIVFNFTASAQQQEEVVSIPKSKLSATQLAEVEQINLAQKIQTYGKWVGIGNEIGIAVNSGLKAVTDNAVNLSETKLGKVTMFLIVWKVIGVDIIQIIVGVFLFVVGISLFIWSYRSSCIKSRVIDKRTYDPVTKQVLSETWTTINDDADENGRSLLYVVVFFVFIVFDMMVMFT